MSLILGRTLCLAVPDLGDAKEDKPQSLWAGRGGICACDESACVLMKRTVLLCVYRELGIPKQA